jgi:plasmid stability protein
MVEFRIRDIEKDVAQEWKKRAQRHNRSLGDELRAVLTEEVWRPRRELAEELREFRESLREKYGTMSDSTDVIRQMRDERG